MEYATSLFIPMALGLWLGQLAHQHWHWSGIWTVVFAIAGFFLGLAMLATQQIRRRK